MHTLRAIRHGERTVLADTVSSRRIYVDAHILPAHHAHVPFPMVRLDIGVTVFWLISIKLRENALAHKHSRRLVDMYIIRRTRLTTLTRVEVASVSAAVQTPSTLGIRVLEWISDVASLLSPPLSLSTELTAPHKIRPCSDFSMRQLSLSPLLLLTYAGVSFSLHPTLLPARTRRSAFKFRTTAPIPVQHFSRISLSATDDDDQSAESPDKSGEATPIDVDQDDRLYRIRLPRAAGIEWGTDLSFAFVYVRGLEPAQPADIAGVEVRDQLCELQAVQEGSSPVPLIGAPFDYVMEAFATLDKTVTTVDLVFFRGAKEELKALCAGTAVTKEPETITVTVIENKGANNEKKRTLTAPVGVNVRELCVDNGINVYQSVTRWTNCKGKQLCGTCIVNVSDGAIQTNRKSMDEDSTLRENPDSYRLSCVTFAYGDVTIETFPPVQASQWTR
jgi:ferredoxin